MTIDGERRSVLDLLNPDAFTVLLLDDGATAPDLAPDVPVTAVRLPGDDPQVQAWADAVGVDGDVAILV